METWTDTSATTGSSRLSNEEGRGGGGRPQTPDESFVTFEARAEHYNSNNSSSGSTSGSSVSSIDSTSMVWKAQQQNSSTGFDGSGGMNGSPCRFVHTQCDKELFSSEYLRSNKASGHKNLRCFPHCCGGHNPKSFCGSGLVVECFLPKCQIVLGRFEEVAKHKKPPTSASTSPIASTPTASDEDGGVSSNSTLVNASTTSSGVQRIEIGGEYSRKELFDEVKVPDQPFGKWFRGTIIPKAADRACFLINGNRQSWHYGWQSSRLNCKNLHVFKVYFFNQSDHNPGTLTCIAELASPAFRISSSRKARKTFRSPVLLPLTTVHNAHNGSAVAGALNGAVPSIDMLLGKPNSNSNATTTSATKPQLSATVMESNRFPSHQRRSLVDPSTLAAMSAPSSGNSYFASKPSIQRHSGAGGSARTLEPADTSARRERKRHTRSASLKSDYYTNVSLPSLQQASASMSATHPPPQFVYPERSVDRPVTPTLPGVSSFLNSAQGSSNDGNSARLLHTRRSSLAALPMPSISSSSSAGVRSTGLRVRTASGSTTSSRPIPVTTPITGMMQLRLETPRENMYTPSASPIASPPPSSSPPPSTESSSTYLTASALHQHAYASANPYPYRRESWHGAAPTGFHPLMMAPSASPTDGYLNRKRNRSTDSDKAIAAAIEASEQMHFNPDGSIVQNEPEPDAAIMERDEDLYRRARILQLAFTIVKRIHRFEEVAKTTTTITSTGEDSPSQHAKVLRHSFEMIIPAVPGIRGRQRHTLVQIPLSNHQLLHLCSNLVAVCTSLISNGLVVTIRQKLLAFAQAGRDIYSAYAELVEFIDDAVREQVAQLPRRMYKSWGDVVAETESEWDLYAMLKSCEACLMQEPWWYAIDEDDAMEEGEEQGDNLPFMGLFTDYYQAIQAAIPSPSDLELAASLRDAALTGVGGLTGEWIRESEGDELNLQRANNNVSASLSWFTRQMHAHMTQIFHITETATTMTLVLPNSLISSDAVFLLQLDKQEPTVVLPQDFFPFGFSRKRLLMAYRAWRVRSILDKNGSAIAVQFMRWPEQKNTKTSATSEEEDDDSVVTEPEEEPLERGGALMRTRITVYFSVFSTNRLQVRTIVEGSMAPSFPGQEMPAYPTEADMLQYFKSPSSWELMSQFTEQYGKKM